MGFFLKQFSIVFLAFFFALPIVGQEENVFLRRIQSHLIIKDYHSAREEAKTALDRFPNSILLHETYIKTLSKTDDERLMLNAWNAYVSLFPDKKNNRELIEEMAWGVLHKASKSHSLPIRLMSMIAGFFSQDSRGIEMLRLSLNDSSNIVRAAAVMLSSKLRDTKLINEIISLYKNETVWSVRKEVFQAIGKMKIKELIPELEKLIASDETLAEEKVLAIKSLVLLLEENEIKRDAVIKLANSNRAGLRLLASQVISHYRIERDLDQLFKLANDNHSEVRASALQALGLIKPQGSEKNSAINIAKSKRKDPDPVVGISAAWLLTLYSQPEGLDTFEYYLQNNKLEIKLLASSALAATGKYGSVFALRRSNVDHEPYVQLNLALGLIGQQLGMSQSTEILEKVILSSKDKWIWHEEGIFRAVAPKYIKKSESDPSTTSEMDNQIVRLEMLNVLAMIAPEKAQEPIRQFLIERNWGVTGVAAALLLMEGDSSAIDSVQQLLKDENLQVRIQAALVLSLWGREESAINVLEQNYNTADKELKGKILEGIGRIGSINSVPFLIEALKDPSQNLRIIAATALIQCLNH
ncbi:MAG: HEAT repeat domain-containing protein [Parachlamydiaceae bacterium]|nr:HEAT repeat domain-containing protein [Parachlamydiaceae bacterium]